MIGEALQWSVFKLDVGGRRADAPVLVVSRESANDALPVVTVLPLVRMRKGRRIYPNETLLPVGETELESPAILLAHQIRTIPKSLLSVRMGSIEDPTIRSAIRDAVRVQLDLEDALGREFKEATRLESQR